ncbi:unnamed protein product [Rotaria sordida]|uniref:protein-tyrosine-phosphatase n=1 Tax=Rotaria sordida TaxID=392033 RepID=A0A819KYE7_9BILA|nr:unnamed protein product [Rotaria sordida]
MAPSQRQQRKSDTKQISSNTPKSKSSSNSNIWILAVAFAALIFYVLYQSSKENTNPFNRMVTNSKDKKKVNDDNKSSSIFDTPCSSVSSITHDKPDVVIILDDDDDDDDDAENDITIDEQSSTDTDEKDENLILKDLIGKLETNTKLIVVKPNLPIRICTTAVTYSNLQDTHIVMVHNPRMSTSECITKRQAYMNEPCSSLNVPIQTRVLHRSLSMLGFIYEMPCSIKNKNRYLVLYDNFTASYHSHSEFHLCLCQDFRRHILNIDYKDLRSHYQHAFQNSNLSRQSNYTIGNIIRVRKFGAQYHNVRIIDIDYSIIKICFFERKSKKEIWIHSNSSIIEQSQQILQLTRLTIPPSPQTPTEEISNSYSDLSRLRKRKSHSSNTNKGGKKLRDESNTKQTSIQHQSSISSSSISNEKTSTISRNNIVTTYYTNILLPKFRILNTLPSTSHKCSRQCVLIAEENFSPKKIQTNPFLLPFECNWSIVDSKPRGYRTPCRRTLYSLDDIEQYLYLTQSKLSIKFFVDGVLTRFKPSIDDYDKKFIILNDLSKGQENVEISVYNDTDNDKPDNFTYITKIQPIDNRISAALNDTNMTSCCDCTDNCNDRMKCACFRKTLNQAQLNQDPLVIEKEKNRYTLSYMLKTTGYQRKRLLNPISSGVYECNSKCSCHREHCSNRLVQQGLFVHLQMFKDKLKGWGLRALHDLPRGTFICQYIGELLTSDQGHERAQSIDDKYQTSLDLVKQVRYEINNEDGDDDVNDDDDDEPYVVDGSLYSNLGKYFNHSCEPNMFIQNVFIESHDLHFPNLALFTRTHVKAGQELTWHYNCELLPDRESTKKTNESFFYLKLATSFIQQLQNTMRLNNKNNVHSSSVVMPTNTSLSSSQSTDESLLSTIQLSNISKTKTNLLSRMISLKNSSNNKTSICRSYNMRTFELAQDHYSIVIHFLDDTERTFFIDRRCKGIDLLNEVFDYLNLSNERKYFGLLIEDLTQDFAYRWLDSTKILKKQLKTNILSYHLYFKIRFFLINPSIEIDDEFSKYLYVLQLKKELLNGKILCPRSTAALLASYIVQSELGDYNLNEHQQGYLNDFHFVPFQNSDFEKEVQQYHKQHRGQSPADAENNYLRVASSLDMYGVELHKASVKISNTNHSIYSSIVELYVGVCAIGIYVFQNSIKINTFSWEQITKISFKRRTFYVQLVKSPNSSDNNSIVFTLRNYRCCKYLWKSCVDHHTFFRLTSLPKNKVFQFTNKLRYRTDIIPNELLMKKNEKRQKTFERVSNRRNIRSKTGSSTLPISSSSSSNNNNHFFINKKSNLQKILSLSSSNISISKSDKIINKQLSTPSKPPRQTSFINSILVEANEYKPKNIISSQNDYRDSPRILNQNFLLNNSTISNEILSIDSNVILIKLKPDIDGRYGFNIKGGKDKQTSTIISKVASNTPASRALLQEGDIILAINNIDIRNHSYAEIINMIRRSCDRSFDELELHIKSFDGKNLLKESLEILRNDISSNRLIEQYQTLHRLNDSFTFEIGRSEYNYYHNRYKDVLPYDQTRVILKNNSENDYINANYINMPINSTDIINRYIATQGPLPITCEPFWRMIWEQQCTLIIMLTTLFENGRIKCHQYWPNMLETIDYGLFTIRCCRERKENELIYRELLILNNEINDERIIYQIQCETWPDHDIPNNYSSFVDFVLEIRELRKANKHIPILVHCSAGIGRTGVLILLETALCLIEANQPIYPLNIVRQMREQRLGMIQTASQYQFACEAILYAYDHGLIESQ